MELWRLNTLPDLMTALGWLYNGLGAAADGYAFHKGWLDTVRLTSLNEDVAWPQRGWAREVLARDLRTSALLTEIEKARREGYSRLSFELRSAVVRDAYLRLCNLSFAATSPVERAAPPQLLNRGGEEPRHSWKCPRLVFPAVCFQWDSPFQAITFLQPSASEEQFASLLETESHWGSNHVVVPVHFFEALLYSGIAKNPFHALDFAPGDVRGMAPNVPEIRWDLVTAQAKQLTVSLGGYLRSGLEKNPARYFWRYLQKLERLSLFFRANLLVVPEPASHAVFADAFPHDAAVLHPIMADLEAGLGVNRYLQRLPQMLQVYEKLGQAAGGVR